MRSRHRSGTRSPPMVSFDLECRPSPAAGHRVELGPHKHAHLCHGNGLQAGGLQQTRNSNPVLCLRSAVGQVVQKRQGVRLACAGIVCKQETDPRQLDEVVVHGLKLMGKRVHARDREREARIVFVGESQAHRFAIRALSDCRVFGVQRLEAVQNMHYLHRFVGSTDNGNLLANIYVNDFEWFTADSGGERGIRTPGRGLPPTTV